jgi:pullulanase/glycogen debranching enzyme
MHIEQARLETLTRLHIQFSSPPTGVEQRDIIIAPAVKVIGMTVDGFEIILDVEGMDLSRTYSLLLRGGGIVPLNTEPCLDGFRSELPLGCITEEGVYVFRLFAPRARGVRLHLFEDIDDDLGSVHFLERLDDGIWQLVLERPLDERWYAYSVEGSRDAGEMFNSRILIGDPYARAVATRNTFRHAARCLLPDHIPSFDWEGDAHVPIRPGDLVVYELHVKDVTAHPSSGVDQALAGTYSGLAADSTDSVLGHIRSLGANAVELLPCQQYAWIEPPYQQHAGGGIYNDWNPYERNHWGYMTSYYFAPEPRYSVHADQVPGHWNTAAPDHIAEFKNMVKAMHRTGLAVIMDVVYNHTSQYDYQPLKYIDAHYYFRVDAAGTFLNSSGCGNDLNSRMPMTRRMIVESVLYWLEEYHIDGFRFDLASIIDRETFEEIRDRAREIYPDVILIAEPWGGEYDPAGFSALDIPSWNDVFRNGVKGYDPMHGKGYLFGSWGSSVPEDFGKWVLGSIRGKGGPFLSPAHAVNYLESHDGYTLGDFIRIATGSARPGQVISDRKGMQRLGPKQMKIARLAAVMLVISRGNIMLHAGQEWARSKIVADTGLHGSIAGVLDHNSYEKDDETNWLDYQYRELNHQLHEYYQGLLRLRRELRPLRHAPEDAYHFLSSPTSLASGFLLETVPENEEILVLVNANHREAAEYRIQVSRRWKILADATHAGMDVLGIHEGSSIRVPALSAMILRAASS